MLIMNQSVHDLQALLLKIMIFFVKSCWRITHLTQKIHNLLMSSPFDSLIMACHQGR